MNQLLFSLLFFPLLFLMYIFIKPGSKKYKLPPSPLKLPLLGNLHQILQDSPHHTLFSLAQKHGPLILLQLGSIPSLVISSANIARDVIKTHDHIFSSRPKLKFPYRLLFNADIAFTPYGEYWRQVRKICVLQLLNTKRVQSYRSYRYVREEEMKIVMEKLQGCSVSSSEVDLSEMFTMFAKNIVCRVALGRRYEEDGRGSKFKEMLKEYTYLLGVSNVADFIPLLGWINHLNGLNARVEKIFREIYSFLDVVEEHREKNSIGGGNKEEDFVDIMLGIEKDSNLGVPFTRENHHIGHVCCWN